MNAIEVNGISKTYKSVVALNNVSFSVGEGELFGLIGPDGAGKTTLFRLLTTLLTPDSGTATVNGFDTVKDYKSIRNCVGYMPGKFSLYPDLTVEENVEFFAALFGVTLAENYDLIAPIYTQIEPFKRRKAGKLSGGMKQKLALCCALIHKPKVLFLDEPTTGVDAVSRSEFWDMLSELKRKGISMLVSTPYMDEASRCDRIALCNAGSILCIDNPQNLISKFDTPLYAVAADNMYALLKLVRTMPCVDECYPFGEYHHIFSKTGIDCNTIRETLENNGLHNIEIQPITASVEDVFIALTQKKTIDYEPDNTR